MSTASLRDLIGHKITDVLVADDESGIRFVCDQAHDIDYIVEGDCCSESWIAEVLNLPALIGQRVQNAVDLALPDRPNDGRSRQEDDAFYGYRLDTERGSCTIVFRNSSNGYYGGWIGRGSIGRVVRSIVGADDWTAYEKKS